MFLFSEKKLKNPPYISVCIPVYNSEMYFEECLNSVIRQDFCSFEIVIVNDGSFGQDYYGRNCKSIVKAAESFCNKYRKENHLEPVFWNYIEHPMNLGLLEARRTAVLNALGKYILNVDSDDILAEGALRNFFIASNEGSFDIVQGKSKNIFINKVGKLCEAEQFLSNKFSDSEKKGHDIFNMSWLKRCSWTIWNKLIKRELYTNALECIPKEYVNFSEDQLALFFVSLFAGSYIGLDYCTYFYRINSGMTKKALINNIDIFKKQLSRMIFYNVVSQYMLEHYEYFSKKEIRNLDEVFKYEINPIIRSFMLCTPNIRNLVKEIILNFVPENKKTLTINMLFYAERFLSKHYI